MSQQAPQVKLHIYEAAEAPVAVILRQGPSRHTRMIFWDQRDDTFNDGQWVRHKIYYERCDLSPDGKHFLYFLLDGQWSNEAGGSYTAISRPPYFTALALHPEGSTWGGGGYFVSNTRFALESTYCPRDIVGRAGPLAPLHRMDRPPPRPRRAPPPVGRLRKFETEAGRLYDVTEGPRRLIRDFTDMVFEPIRAPYDWRPETEDRP